MNKKIVIITTEHSIQKNDYSSSGEFRNIVLYLVSVSSPQIILEEWRSDGASTVGRLIANEELAGAWHNVSPPADLGLSWDKRRNLDGLLLREYGPIALQTAREKYMIDQIQEATNQLQTALLIAGLAHHQSLAEKLANLGYDVEAFYWIKPGGLVPECVHSVWKWKSE